MISGPELQSKLILLLRCTLSESKVEGGSVTGRTLSSVLVSLNSRTCLVWVSDRVMIARPSLDVAPAKCQDFPAAGASPGAHVQESL